MRVIELSEFGGPENLREATRHGPVCGPMDIRIAVRAVSFNPIDYKLRQRAYDSARLPLVLGFDVAGTVTETGQEVSDIARGDAVMAYLGGPSMAGGYASEVVVPRALAGLKPRNIGFAEAAAIPLTALTALQCLKRTGIAPSQSLLVTGAAGGVGSWVILIARALGVTRISATAGRTESAAYLHEECNLPAGRIIDYYDTTSAELTARTLAANDGAFYDVAIDCAGGLMTHLSCETIGLGGHVVSIVNGPDPSVEEVLFDRSATFHSELVYAAAETGDPARYGVYARQLAELAALIERQALRLPRLTDLGPLSAASVAEAHRLLAGGKTIGKLVARVD